MPWHAFYISLFLSGTFWPRHHHMTIPVSSHSSSEIILRPTAPFVSKGSVAKIFACVVLRHSNFGLCVQDRMASTCSALKTQPSQLAKKIRHFFLVEIILFGARHSNLPPWLQQPAPPFPIPQVSQRVTHARAELPVSVYVTFYSGLDLELAFWLPCR